ncbi:UxaA family hydrolase [Maritalea mediterranea]|uniref:Altronate dehydratase family protein n=1 Tax=Maritalea mediterranea TaxID=2909667 RepID=A0ABS9EAZ2_9HYPH|nr:altronate dehydratase family protein [Maritalea mediterranea]MCF4099354.1 altronate dehydratase family protein [Maritalea mediterranea]
MTQTRQLHKDDNVVVLIEAVAKGAQPLGEGTPLAAPLAAGHKIACDAIAEGAPIRKLGQVIGYASQPIARGEHVHSHNCAFGDHKASYDIGGGLEAAQAAIPKVNQRQFNGYVRENGQVGTRNMIALIATVNCSATTIRQAAMEVQQSGILGEYPNVDGIVACTHSLGCGMAADGPGWDNLQRVLWGYATHPNVGAAAFIGLGCEVMQIGKLKHRFGGSKHDRFFGLTIQETGGTRATIDQIVAHIHTLLPEVNKVRRAPAGLEHLTIGLQCGGSDGYSGITANPALGYASDLLVAHGATVILSETPEIYGAEQLLLQRAANQQVADDLLERIAWWQHYVSLHQGTLDNNPSPGNKAGGLTTILEKSLGAIAKAGATPLNEVVHYGEKPKGRGLVFMDTPGYDPVSATGQIAGGTQMIVFTTGRGSAFGSKPAPTLKLATNDRLFETMPDDMDINCGDIVSQSVSIEEKGRQIFEQIITTAEGTRTKSEVLGLGDHEFVPWQVGAVM